MSSDAQNAPVSKAAFWTGYVISVLVVLVFLMSGIMKLVKPPDLAKGFDELGWNVNLANFLAALELASAVIYLIPRTSILGAVLLTGYIGGAIATHVRIGDPFLGQVFIGVLVWLGLYLREQRVRALLPLRQSPSAPATSSGGFMTVLKNAFIILVVVIVVLLGLIALQPSDFRITRSASMNAPPSEVFAQVNDFHKWDAWSPWEKRDLAMKKTFEGPTSGKGAIYKWAGNSEVGEGAMLILDSQPNDLVEIKLDFIKPFEDTSITEFTLTPNGNQTVVTWTMSGEKNFLSKAFCLVMNMDKLIGGDFEKGLKSMKETVESGKK